MLSCCFGKSPQVSSPTSTFRDLTSSRLRPPKQYTLEFSRKPDPLTIPTSRKVKPEEARAIQQAYNDCKALYPEGSEYDLTKTKSPKELLATLKRHHGVLTRIDMEEVFGTINRLLALAKTESLKLYAEDLRFTFLTLCFQYNVFKTPEDLLKANVVNGRKAPKTPIELTQQNEPDTLRTKDARHLSGPQGDTLIVANGITPHTPIHRATDGCVKVGLVTDAAGTPETAKTVVIKKTHFPNNASLARAYRAIKERYLGLKLAFLEPELFVKPGDDFLYPSTKTPGRYVYVFPMENGEKVSDKHTGMSQRETLNMIHAMARALKVCHTLNIAHNDTTARNMIRIGKHYKLIDFGNSMFLGKTNTLSTWVRIQHIRLSSYGGSKPCRGALIVREKVKLGEPFNVDSLIPTYQDIHALGKELALLVTNARGTLPGPDRLTRQEIQQAQELAKKCITNPSMTIESVLDNPLFDSLRGIPKRYLSPVTGVRHNSSTEANPDDISFSLTKRDEHRSPSTLTPSPTSAFTVVQLPLSG